ncbi:MAG: energy transducer TonB [Cytophagaceae bacterium]|jgi:TonB family protein|nr:energy transducer TonB [Cytophagaceae bacterium]
MNRTLKIFIYSIVLVMFLSVVQLLPAQKQRMRRSADKLFTEHYQVKDEDTSVWDGKYELYYKSNLIERGRYKEGKRSGSWMFFNLGSLFEFQYDFTRDTLLRRAGSEYHEMRNFFPPLFLGSPLIPYIFISSRVGYPVEAIDNKVEGKIILTLVISTEGKIVDSYISKSLNEMMDEIVLKTAEDFPDDWEWIPAKKDGVKVESPYNITIHFDLK